MGWGISNVPSGNGTQGSAGADGNTWISGSGAPSDLGSSVSYDTYYLDVDSLDVYKLDAGQTQWPSNFANLKGDLGTTGATGNTGNTGVSIVDADISDGTTAIGGTVYAVGTLVLKTEDHNGANTYINAGITQGATGATGQQGPTGNTGASGADGTLFFVSDTAPSANASGDLWLDTDDYTLYKAGASGTGSWTNSGNIKGVDGATWYSGTVDPATSLGIKDDFYFRTDTKVWSKKSEVYAKLEMVGVTAANDGDSFTFTAHDGADAGQTFTVTLNSSGADDSTFTANAATLPSGGTAGDLSNKLRTLLGSLTGYTASGSSNDVVLTADAYATTTYDISDLAITGADTFGVRTVTAGEKQWDEVASVTDGTDGTDGSDGSQWTTSTSNPVDSAGVNGDFHLNTASNLLYEKRAVDHAETVTWAGFADNDASVDIDINGDYTFVEFDGDKAEYLLDNGTGYDYEITYDTAESRWQIRVKDEAGIEAIAYQTNSDDGYYPNASGWTLNSTNYPSATLGSATNATSGTQKNHWYSLLSLTGSTLSTFTTSADGLVPMSDGTNESTKFLRGDGSWQVPSGSISGIDDLSDVDTTSSAPTNNQVLKWSASGSKWTPVDDTNTTYNNFGGADGSNAGTAGLVPQPAGSDNTKFLQGDGTWAEVPQNIPTFKNVAVSGSNTVTADSVTDTLTLTGAGGVSLASNSSTDEITITGTDTTYDVMGGSNSYASGLVDAGSSTHGGEFLRKDGTWQVPAGGGGGSGLTDWTEDSSGHLLPDADATQDLGSSSKQIRDLYLSGSSIIIGGHKLAINSGELSFTPSGGSALDLTSGSGTAVVSGTDGEDGNSLLSGSGTPAGGTGNNGDMYIDTSGGPDLYGPKTGGSWGSGTSLKGSTGATGSAGNSITILGTVANEAGLPAVGGTSAGDAYITETPADHLWVSDGSSAWTDVGEVRGPQGDAGSNGLNGQDGATWTSGSSSPTGGTDGDFYLSTTDSKVHKRTSGTWAEVADLTGGTGQTGAAGTDGSDGRTILNGAGAPTGATSASNGDFYIDTSNDKIYLKSGGNWDAGTSLIGPTGADGAKGDQGHSSAVTVKGSVADSSSLPTTGNTTGDGYITIDDGHLHVYDGGSFQDVGEIRGPQGVAGTDGQDGNNGTDGSDGVPAGIQYTWESATSDSHQGDGKVWLDHGTLASVTELYLATKEAGNSVSMSEWIEEFDGPSVGTTGIRGILQITKQADPTQFIIAEMGGALVGGSDYNKIPVSILAHKTTSLADGDAVSVNWTRAGSTGTAGADGSNGNDGNDGTNGTDGVDGNGWKSSGTAYDSATGVVTFASDDGLGFSTGDLRGATGATGQDGDDGADGAGVTQLTTEGDILYRDASGLQRLAKGTAGQFLKINSGATAPEWVDDFGYDAGGNMPSAWWTMNSVSTSTAEDSSGNSHDITWYNSPSSAISKRGENAIELVRSSTQYGLVTQSTDFYADNMEAFSFCGWFNKSDWESVSSAEYIIDNATHVGDRVGFNLSVNSAGKLYYYCYLGSGTTAVTNSGNASAPDTHDSLTDDRWYHVAVTIAKDGSDLTGKLYIDGVLKTTDTETGYTQIPVATEDLRIGRISNTNVSAWNGLMDDLRIYKGIAIPQSEVQSLVIGSAIQRPDGSSTDTNTTYTTSLVDSSDDAIIRLTGSDASTDDVKLVAGTNITLTPSGDELTIDAANGADGNDGQDGDDGVSTGYTFTWESSTFDDTDGTAGFNGTALASASILYLDDKDSAGSGLEQVYTTWDLGPEGNKGLIYLWNKTDPSKHASFRVRQITESGSGTKWIFDIDAGDASNTAGPMVGVGTFADGDDIVVSFTPTGEEVSAGDGLSLSSVSGWEKTLKLNGFGAEGIRPDAWFRMDGSSTTTETDFSGNRNNISWANSPTKQVEGKRGRYAVELNGTDEYGRIYDTGNEIYGDGSNGQTAWSFCGWFYKDDWSSISAAESIWDNSQTSGDNIGSQCFINSSGLLKAKFWFSAAGGYETTGTDITDLSDDTWHHIAYTIESTTNAPDATLRLYIDGVLKTTNNMSHAGLQDGYDFFTLGASHQADGTILTSSQLWDGRMDDIRIYNGHAISQAEIHALIRGDAVQSPAVINLEDCEDVDNMAGVTAGATLINDGYGSWTWDQPFETIIVACSDETTALTTGTAKMTFRMPYKFSLTGVRASVTTAPTGSTLVVDVNDDANTVLSTKLSIDASEKTSTTASSSAVLNASLITVADDSEMTIDIDQIGSGTAGAGLKVYLIGKRSA